MKSYKTIIYFLFVLTAGFSSCTEDGGPNIEDHWLNYEIPEIAVTEDYKVGAYYINPGSGGVNAAIWDRLINTEGWNPADGLYGPCVSPILGNWKHGNRASEEVVGIMQQQVDWAIQGGIDFFVLPPIAEVNNRLYPNNMNANDARFINLLTGRIGSDGNPLETTAGTVVDTKGLKYVLTVNSATFNTGLSQTAPIENAAPTKIEGVDVTRVERFYSYVCRLSDYFSDENYFTVNGKPMVVFKVPENIYSEDSKKFYDGMRAAVKEHSGKDIYIVVQQLVWQPSARFEYTFGNGRVDAVTIRDEGGMYNQNDNQRSLMYPQFINENWKYNRELLMAKWGEDFIPSVSPSFTRWVQNGGSYNFPIVPKDVKTFSTICNVAKMNTGNCRVILIDSFNDWKFNTAIEPADPEIGNGFGTQYLELVKKQFKR
jgi:hypothetical protein